VRAYHRAIEELHHMRGLAGLRQELQERLERHGVGVGLWCSNKCAGGVVRGCDRPQRRPGTVHNVGLQRLFSQEELVGVGQKVSGTSWVLPRCQARFALQLIGAEVGEPHAHPTLRLARAPSQTMSRRNQRRRRQCRSHKWCLMQHCSLVRWTMKSV
jgi:hypothetical protein